MNEGNDPKLKMFTKLQNVPQITSKGEYFYNACITFYNLLLLDASCPKDRCCKTVDILKRVDMYGKK